MQYEESNSNQSLPPHYWGNTPEQDYYSQQGIRSTQTYHTSPRGLTLFTRTWEPPSTHPPRGSILMVHGYGNDISWTFQATPIHLAQNGFSCFALDLQGHGLSHGLKAYIPNLSLVLDDILSFYDAVFTQNPILLTLPKFLHGESMGGAICLLLHFLRPKFFSGAVLIAPMVRISDKVRPRWPIPEILSGIARVFPTLPIVPTADLMEKSVKVEEKRRIGGMNPLRYKGRPRLGTVAELLRATEELGRRLGEVEIPFVVMHGSEDVVTDPELSRELYEKARSRDKSLKIYDGMMHSLLWGETDENVEIVRRDILRWLSQRC